MLLADDRFKAKCTKFDFGCGSAVDPAGGSYRAPPFLLAGFKGPTSKWREGLEGRGRNVREGRSKGKERKGEKEGLPPSEILNSLLEHT